jgi:dienelactone hydrolase
VRALFGAILVVLVAVPAASGYRNPTRGSVLALQIPGMHRAKVRRNVVYRTIGPTRLRLDVYRSQKAQGALPAVLLGGSPAFAAGKDSGQKIGWAQLISASGLAAVAFDIRSDSRLETPRDPAEDVAAAIDYVRANARRLGVDPDRLCTLGFSIGTAPWHLWATMRDPQPWLKCNVDFYGPLDFDDFDFGHADEFAARAQLEHHGARIPPLLVVKAGTDERQINDSIDRFSRVAAAVHADVRVVTHSTGAHGFDVLGRVPGRRRSSARRSGS